jgi:transposase
MLLVDGSGLPLSIDVDSARPGEVTLIEPLLEQIVVSRLPNRLIYDRAADSDPLRARLAERGVELICPHRRGRKRPATQDGRPLRRYRKRWIVERTIGWLKAFRRLVTRYEFYAFLFHSFAKLACLMIVLRRF